MTEGLALSNPINGTQNGICKVGRNLGQNSENLVKIKNNQKSIPLVFLVIALFLAVKHADRLNNMSSFHFWYPFLAYLTTNNFGGIFLPHPVLTHFLGINTKTENLLRIFKIFKMVDLV